MQITFSKEEFVAMLATLWGIPLGLADLVFDFDEMTGDVRTFTITGMDAKSLSKIGAVASWSPPKTRVPALQPIVTIDRNSNLVIAPSSTTSGEVTDHEEDQDELDDIIRKSHELMLQGQPPPAPDDPNANELLMYPGASAEFPVEFANRTLGK